MVTSSSLQFGAPVPPAQPSYDAANALEAVFPGVKPNSQFRAPTDPLSQKNPGSQHINRWDTIDVSPIPGVSYDQFIQKFKDAGYRIGESFDEAANPIPGLTTGPNWHVQILAGPAGLEGPPAVADISTVPAFGSPQPPLQPAGLPVPEGEKPSFEGVTDSPVKDQPLVDQGDRLFETTYRPLEFNQAQQAHWDDYVANKLASGANVTPEELVERWGGMAPLAEDDGDKASGNITLDNARQMAEYMNTTRKLIPASAGKLRVDPIASAPTSDFGLYNEEADDGWLTRQAKSIGRSVLQAAQYGAPGWLGANLAYYQGQGFDQLKQLYPNASEEELNDLYWEVVNELQERMRDSDVKAVENDSTAPWLFGQLLVGLGDPANVIPLGKAAGTLKQLGGQVIAGGGLNVANDLFWQNVDVARGAQEEVSYEQAAFAGALGAGITGGLGALQFGRVQAPDGSVAADTPPPSAPVGPLPGLTPEVASPLVPDQIRQQAGIPEPEKVPPGLLRSDLRASTAITDPNAIVRGGEAQIISGQKPLVPTPASAAPELPPAVAAARERTTPGSYTREEAQQHLDTITAGWKRKPAYEVVDSLEDVADQNMVGQLYDADSAESPVIGFVGEDGVVRIVAGRITSPEVLRAVTFHESLGHYGLSVRYREDLNDSLAHALDSNSTFARDTDAWLANPNNQETYSHLPAREQRLRAAEEVLAERSEAGIKIPGLTNRLRYTIKKYLRQMGLSSERIDSISDRELDHFLALAHESVINGRGVPPVPGEPSVIRPMRALAETAARHGPERDMSPERSQAFIEYAQASGRRPSEVFNELESRQNPQVEGEIRARIRQLVPSRPMLAPRLTDRLYNPPEAALERVARETGITGMPAVNRARQEQALVSGRGAPQTPAQRTLASARALTSQSPLPDIQAAIAALDELRSGQHWRVAADAEYLQDRLMRYAIRPTARPSRGGRTDPYDPQKVENAGALAATADILSQVSFDSKAGPALRRYWAAARDGYFPEPSDNAILKEAMFDRLGPFSELKPLRELWAAGVLTRGPNAPETLDDIVILMREEAEALDREAWVPTAKPMVMRARPPEGSKTQGGSRREGYRGKAYGKYWSNRDIEDILNNHAPGYSKQEWGDWVKVAESIRKLGPNRIEEAVRGGNADASVVLAARLYLTESANRIHDLARMHRAGTLTPELRAEALAESIRNAALQEALEGVVGNASRIVNSMRIVVGSNKSLQDSVAQAMKRGGGVISDEGFDDLMTVVAESKDAVAETRRIRDAFRPKLADYVTSIWYSNVLSRPSTQFNNIVGTAEAMIGDQVTNLFQTGFGGVQKALGGPATDRMTLREATARNWGLGEGLRQAIVGLRFIEAWKQGKPISGHQTEAENLPWSALFDNAADSADAAASKAIWKSLGVASRVVEIAPRTMAALDEIFRSAAMTSEIYGQAAARAVQENLKGEAFSRRLAELIKEPPMEFIEAALRKAQLATYRDAPSPFGGAVEKLVTRSAKDSELSRAGKALMRALFVPFIITPDSIIRTAIRHTPLIGFLDRYNKADWASGAKGKARVLARMSFGAMVLGAYEMLYRQGALHSALEEDYNKRNTMEIGALPGATPETSNDLISLENLGPFTLMGTIYATLRDGYDRGKISGKDFATNTAELSLVAASQALDSAWAEQSAGLIGATEEARRGEASSKVNNYFSGQAAALMTPGIVQSFNQAFVDPAYRDTGGETLPEAVRGRIASGWPGQSRDLPQRYGPLGEPLERPGGWAQFLMGNRIIRQPDAPEDRAVQQLEEELGKDPLGRAQNRISLDGQEVELNRSERSRYARTAGQYIRDDLSQLLLSGEWQSMTSEERKEAIDKIKRVAREDARFDEFWNSPSWRGNQQ